MEKLTHKDFRLALKKWIWRLKNYDYYFLSIDENIQRMIKDIPELEEYHGNAYCTFCAKFTDHDNGCPGCPFPKEENCISSNTSIYHRWLIKTKWNMEDASAEAKEMVQLIRRLYKEWKNEKRNTV